MKYVGLYKMTIFYWKKIYAIDSGFDCNNFLCWVTNKWRNTQQYKSLGNVSAWISVTTSMNMVVVPLILKKNTEESFSLNRLYSREKKNNSKGNKRFWIYPVFLLPFTVKKFLLYFVTYIFFFRRSCFQNNELEESKKLMSNVDQFKYFPIKI